MQLHCHWCSSTLAQITRCLHSKNTLSAILEVQCNHSERLRTQRLQMHSISFIKHLSSKQNQSDRIQRTANLCSVSQGEQGYTKRAYFLNDGCQRGTQCKNIDALRDVFLGPFHPDWQNHLTVSRPSSLFLSFSKQPPCGQWCTCMWFTVDRYASQTNDWFRFIVSHVKFFPFLHSIWLPGLIFRDFLN